MTRSAIPLTLLVMSLMVSTLIIPIGSSEVKEKDFGKVVNAAPMITARFNHTATTLNDGTVLVVGGTMDGYSSLNAPELYDPKKDEWTPLLDMRDPRMRHTANLLPTGEILIVGGFVGTGKGHPSLYPFYKGPGNMSLDRCELYDPITRSFKETAPLNTGRFWQRAITLNDGRVLVIGGVNVTHAGLSSCEIFDPAKSTWEYTGELKGPRVRFTATLLSNGSVMVTGGHDGRTKVPTASCELYVPEGGRWYTLSSMNEARGYHSAVLLANERLLVSGGFSGPNMPDLSSAEIFDPSTKDWTRTEDMGMPRHAHNLVLMNGIGAVAHGGYAASNMGSTVNGIELYDEEKGTWEVTYLMLIGTRWPAETELKDGSQLICGGETCCEARTTVEVHRPPQPSSDGSDLRVGLVTVTFGLFTLLFFLLGIAVWSKVKGRSR